MLIREATTRDARAIARVQVRGWQIGYKGIVPDEYLARFSVQDFTNRWLTNLAEPVHIQHLVAELEDETVAGWAAFGANQGELPPEIGELGGLYVDPDHWDAGIGGALLAEAERGLIGEGYERAVLWTLEANSRTRQFYERRGWTHDGATQPHRSGVTVVRYVKDLAPSGVDPTAAPEYDSSDEQT
jgi:GNAT superfamily N-acetyltransferase